MVSYYLNVLLALVAATSGPVPCGRTLTSFMCRIVHVALD